MTVVWLLAGLALLVAGGELLVRGASRLAATIGVSPLVIGLTVVAYGTSSPELAVSVQAAVDGRSDIALGNVVGSNVFNVLLILGVSAAITPLLVARKLVRLEVPLLIGLSVLMLLLALDGGLGAIDGGVMLAILAAYTVFIVSRSRSETRAERAADGHLHRPGRRALLVQLALVGAGLVLLVLGSRWLVRGASELAASLGVSELVIALTVVAAGTGMPEVATSVIAALRGQRDIAVGNIVGSNMFNIAMVIGLTGVIAPGGLDVAADVLRFDLPVMIAVAVACLPIFFTGCAIARWEGLVFLAYYAAYLVYLVLDATSHWALSPFATAMVGFVLPLTVLTLGVLAVRAHREHRRFWTADPDG